MDILQYLGDHFWLILIFFFVFGGSVWGAVQWILHRMFQHREHMQNLSAFGRLVLQQDPRKHHGMNKLRRAMILAIKSKRSKRPVPIVETTGTGGEEEQKGRMYFSVRDDEMKYLY